MARQEILNQIEAAFGSVPGWYTIVCQTPRWNSIGRRSAGSSAIAYCQFEIKL